MVRVKDDVEYEHILDIPLRIEIEYEGEIYKLTDPDACKMWIEQVNSGVALEHAHGIKCDPIPWEIYVRSPEREEEE